jgi:hypothetical protein
MGAACKVGDYLGEDTHPPVFGRRGCKLLKTKDGIRKKRGKRPQEYRRKGVSLAWRRAEGIICWANITYIIILVYRVSSIFYGGKHQANEDSGFQLGGERAISARTRAPSLPNFSLRE